MSTPDNLPEFGAFLVVDLETSGLPIGRNTSVRDLNKWPRIVEVGWVLYDVNWVPLEKYSTLIRPVDFRIPESVIAIHGITNELAMKEGIAIEEALKKLLNVIDRVCFLVVHNLSFDRKVIESELCRAGLKYDFAHLIQFCTMKESAKFCRLERKFGSGYKYPSLAELHWALFRRSAVVSHRALSDVELTAKCAQKLLRLKVMYRASELVNYHSKVVLLRSVHIDDPLTIDWSSKLHPDLKEPEYKDSNEAAALSDLDLYKGSLFSKMIGWFWIRRISLRLAVKAGRNLDQAQYQSRLNQYDSDSKEQCIAQKVQEGGVDGRLCAFTASGIVEWLAKLGVGIHVSSCTADGISVIIQIPEDEVIPKKTVRSLRNGGFSEKPMTAGFRGKLLYEHICGILNFVSRSMYGTIPNMGSLTILVRTSACPDGTVVASYALESNADVPPRAITLTPSTTLSPEKLRTHFASRKGLVPFAYQAGS